LFYTLNMETGKKAKRWERTNTTNLWKLALTGGYYARVKVNGKEKWRSLKTKILSVAKLRLADFERAERAKGQSGPVASTLCGALLDIFLAQEKAKTENAESSKTRIDIAAGALLKTWPGFREMDARRVTQADCAEWARRALSEGTGFHPPGTRDGKRRGMAASSYNKTLGVLRGVMAAAVKAGVLYTDPSGGLKRMKPAKKELILPSAEQFKNIVDFIAGAGARQSRDCADMVRLLAYSGTRINEAARLRWDYLDTARGTLRIRGTKSASSDRYLPLFQNLKLLLDEIRARRPHEAGTARILHVRECKNSLAGACAKAGVARMTHHDLRHLFATRCIEAGVDIPTVSRWLGHADGGALAMRTYGHLRQDHSQAQAAKVVW
jgi:integrase